MAEEFLNVEEAAAVLKLRPVTIYRWCRAGRLAAVKVGKAWRIPRATVAALLRASGWERDLGRAGAGGPLAAATPAGWALARRLLLHEADGHPDPAALAVAAGRVHARLRAGLAGAIGAIGVATLLARARRLAQAEHPALAQCAGAEGAGGPPDAVARAGDPAAVAAGVTALLATFIGLLGTFIGEDLALRLVRDAWPELADDAVARAGTEGGA